MIGGKINYSDLEEYEDRDDTDENRVRSSSTTYSLCKV